MFSTGFCMSVNATSMQTKTRSDLQNRNQIDLRLEKRIFAPSGPLTGFDIS